MEHVVRSPVAGHADLPRRGRRRTGGRRHAAGRGRGRRARSTARPTVARRSTSTTSGPTSPSCSPDGTCWPTPAGPTSSPDATPAGAGPPARTSPTSSTTGSFTEYGGFAIAAQRRRRDLDELIERTPADGLVGGTARVNGDRFDDEHARCAVVSYDYTVLAGTQGQQNHRKKDRLFELVERLRLPVVLFAEGGGGRPGDTDYAVITGLDTQAFALFGRLSGLVPLVGIASGRCFAGNAALLGCCDVIIATEGSVDRHGRPGHDRGRGTRHLPPRGDRSPGRAGAQRGGRPGGGRRRRGRRPGPSLPLLLPGPGGRLGVRRPAPAAVRRARAAAAGLRHPGARRRPGRHGLRARAPARVRGRHGHGPGPHRGATRRHPRQRPDPSRRGHRRRRRRQGGPVPAAVRRPRPAGGVAVRHARVHGRPRGRADRPGAPRQPHVRRRAPA